MIFEHLIFKEKPPDNLIRRLHCTAVTTRQQYLSRCRERALAILATGNKRGAIASMLHDVTHWEDGQLYDTVDLDIRRVEAAFYMTTPEEVRSWIDAFR